MTVKHRRHLELVPGTGSDARVTLETPEHEQIEFEGCTPEEVKAKLHDFFAWAS
jgi:hypothetical protein